MIAGNVMLPGPSEVEHRTGGFFSDRRLITEQFVQWSVVEVVGLAFNFIVLWLADYFCETFIGDGYLARV